MMFFWFDSENLWISFLMLLFEFFLCSVLISFVVSVCMFVCRFVGKCVWLSRNGMYFGFGWWYVVVIVVCSIDCGCMFCVNLRNGCGELLLLLFVV